MLIDLLYFSLSHLYFSFCVSLESSLQSMCWQVYFLHKVEETWVYDFWLTHGCLRRCRHAGDDSYHPDCPATLFISSHYLSLKTNCSVFWWKTESYNPLTPFSCLFLSQEWHVQVSSELNSCQSYCRSEILFQYLFPNVMRLFSLEAQLSPMSLVEVVPDIRQCWVLGLETPMRRCPCFNDLRAQGERDSISIWESQMGMIGLITKEV